MKPSTPSISWWDKNSHLFLNANFIGAAVIIAVFIFFLIKATRKKKRKFAFRGIGKEIRNDIKKSSKLWKYRLRRPRRRNVMEGKCRMILERIYMRPFPSVRPDFLKNPTTGKNLELDCYNSGMKLALEYDGKQHAQYTPHFHRNGHQDFIYQTVKDDWKDKKCKMEGITLIRVPHFIPENKLEHYIRDKLIKFRKL